MSVLNPLKGELEGVTSPDGETDLPFPIQRNREERFGGFLATIFSKLGNVKTRWLNKPIYLFPHFQIDITPQISIISIV